MDRSLAAAGPLVVVHGGGRAIDAELRRRGITALRRWPSRDGRSRARRRHRCSRGRTNTAPLRQSALPAVGLD
jgi:hypothetical protein